jgi:hypothetical protein
MEKKDMVFVLNTPVLTDWGEYKFEKISVQEVKNLLQGDFVSAIGHEGTAAIMTRLVGINIPTNRVAIKMNKGDKAVVFRLLSRLPEGKILSEDELKELPYEWGLLEKLK